MLRRVQTIAKGSTRTEYSNNSIVASYFDISDIVRIYQNERLNCYFVVTIDGVYRINNL